MQRIKRTPSSYHFCGERIGRHLPEALMVLRDLGTEPAELIVITGRDGRAIARGTMRDLVGMV